MMVLLLRLIHMSDAYSSSRSRPKFLTSLDSIVLLIFEHYIYLFYTSGKHGFFLICEVVLKLCRIKIRRVPRFAASQPRFFENE